MIKTSARRKLASNLLARGLRSLRTPVSQLSGKQKLLGALGAGGAIAGGKLLYSHVPELAEFVSKTLQSYQTNKALAEIAGYGQGLRAPLAADTAEFVNNRANIMTEVAQKLRGEGLNLRYNINLLMSQPEARKVLDPTVFTPSSELLSRLSSAPARVAKFQDELLAAQQGILVPSRAPGGTIGSVDSSLYNRLKQLSDDLTHDFNDALDARLPIDTARQNYGKYIYSGPNALKDVRAASDIVDLLREGFKYNQIPHFYRWQVK